MKKISRGWIINYIKSFKKQRSSISIAHFATSLLRGIISHSGKLYRIQMNSTIKSDVMYRPIQNHKVLILQNSLFWFCTHSLARRNVISLKVFHWSAREDKIQAKQPWGYSKIIINRFNSKIHLKINWCDSWVLGLMTLSTSLQIQSSNLGIVVD